MSIIINSNRILSIEEKTGQKISQTIATIETNNYTPHIHFLTDRKADSYDCFPTGLMYVYIHAFDYIIYSRMHCIHSYGSCISLGGSVN